MKLTRPLSIAILLTFISSAAEAEYKTSSVFSKSYRCTTNESGGYNHDKGTHHLTRFNGRDTWYLTHISMLPINEIKSLIGDKELSTSEDNEGNIRARAERVLIDRKPSDWISSEIGSYYLRNATNSPNDSHSSVAECEAFEMSGKAVQVACDGIHYKFDFSPETRRFMVMSPGNWVISTMNKPDSSFFDFGTCQEI